MACKRIVMDVTALEDFTQHMAHLLADTEQSDRPALGGFLGAHQIRPAARSPRITRLVKVARATMSPVSSKSSASVKTMVLPIFKHPAPGDEMSAALP